MKKNAFTLMELMVVIIIIGIIAGFALPQYQKAIRKSHERDAIIQLTSLHAANTMYRATNDAYLPGSPLTLAQINANLNLGILANDMTYSYARSSASAYTASATWDIEAGTTNDFMVIINQAPISNTNPCCELTLATCSLLPDC